MNTPDIWGLADFPRSTTRVAQARLFNPGKPDAVALVATQDMVSISILTHILCNVSATRTLKSKEVSQHRRLNFIPPALPRQGTIEGFRIFIAC